MQDLHGQLSLTGLQSEEAQKMKAALEQLQAKSVALQSENAVLHGKLLQTETEAIGHAHTVQKEAAAMIQKLMKEHAQDREVCCMRLAVF